MKNIYRKLRIFFPGRKFYILILNILGLFVVSLFEMLGVAAILPIVNLAMGAPITGYLRTVAELFGNSDRTQLIVIFGVALVLAFVIKGVLSLVIKRWSLGFIATQQSITSVNLLNCYMREPYLVHRKRGAAAVLNSVNDIVGQAYSAFVNGVMSFIGDLLSIVVLMVMLLVLMPLPALFAFAYFGVAAFALQYVLRRKNKEQGEKVIDAIIAGGINFIEITMTMDEGNPVEFIQFMSEKYRGNEKVVIGAGTVLDPETARAVILAGANYVVSPGLNVDTIKLCNRYRIPMLPGVMSPTEAITALESGCDIIKVFPGNVVGPGAISSFKGPLPQGDFMPSGGVDVDNVDKWLKAGACAVGTGSSLTKGAATGDFAAITAKAKEFVEAVAAARK